MSRMFRCHQPTEVEKQAGDAIQARERAAQGWERAAADNRWVRIDR